MNPARPESAARASPATDPATGPANARAVPVDPAAPGLPGPPGAHRSRRPRALAERLADGRTTDTARWGPTHPPAGPTATDFHAPQGTAADVELRRVQRERPVLLVGREGRPGSDLSALEASLRRDGWTCVTAGPADLPWLPAPAGATSGRIPAGLDAVVPPLARTLPALVLVDLLDDPAAGAATVRALRSEPATRTLPVIALVRPDDATACQLALDGGCSEVLTPATGPAERALRLRSAWALQAFEDRLAGADPVTGLPNRRVFLDRLRRTLERIRQQGGALALLRVALDRSVADRRAISPAAAEHLASRIARRLGGCVRRDEDARRGHRVESMLTCRLADGDYAILLPDIDDPQVAVAVARRVLQALSRPLRIGHDDISVAVSVGIVVAPQDGDDPTVLLERAGRAADHARERGASTYRFHAASLNGLAIEHLKIESLLIGARQRGELRLVYQPQIELDRGRIAGVEALLRWHPAGLPPVDPSRFLPLAEASGQIVELGEWVLQTACAQWAAWQDEAEAAGTPIEPPLTLAVNLSAREVAAPGLVDRVTQCLQQHGMPADRLRLELPERVLADPLAAWTAPLEALRRLGVRVCACEIRWSELQLADLRALPMDEIKIDRSLVAMLPQSHAELALVRALVVLAQGLGLTVVAEGIEEPEQLRAMRELGVDRVQGYLLGRPLPPQQCLAWPIDQRFVGRRAIVGSDAPELNPGPDLDSDRGPRTLG